MEKFVKITKTIGPYIIVIALLLVGGYGIYRNGYYAGKEAAYREFPGSNAAKIAALEAAIDRDEIRFERAFADLYNRLMDDEEDCFWVKSAREHR